MTWWTVAIGVDTHKQWHVAVALDSLGRLIDSITVDATSAGYRRCMVWARSLGEPAFAIEGCGSYGAGLAGFLADHREAVFECERPRRGERRGGKNDVIDATLAARRIISGEGLSVPRGGGQREQLRVLLLERRGATRARTAALNQLDAVIVTLPDDLRRRLSGVPKRQLVRTVARLRPRPDGASNALRRIGQRIQLLAQELSEIDDELARLVTTIAPDLLAETGVGPVCAAQLLVSSGDPRRMASEASFAAPAGTNPLDASSGQQQRHRLNRGGDRQLNWALHVIALQRVHHHAETASYYRRLLDAGKTPKEAKRCIKRALARHFYNQLKELQPRTLTT
ncbi:MAG TPA: IS110 family transposase [Gaiellales bacterium]|nr:IS110 family transposase [Gaiellales bacterium]